jgi:predicted heme/steroid binding protein/uncharacterized membrane protein
VKTYDPEELSGFNGETGASVYVAVKGKVIDVSESKLWKGGLHMKRHHAGKDLSVDFQAAPHGEEVLERYPQVGILREKKTPERKIPKLLAWLLARYPMLRRHPHPMMVHFPIAFMLSTPAFTILYLLTGAKSFELTGFYCLGAGVLFTPVAILTGFYTWWLNYRAKSTRPVAVKQRVSLILLALEIVLFVWRAHSPGILDTMTGAGSVYFLLLLALLPLVSIIGWFGAKLTFPIERE